MKTLYKYFMQIVLIILPMLCFTQEVSNLAEVTANGGISVDEEGNLFVAHFGPLPPNAAIGKSIYKITPDGMVSLFVDGQLNVGSGNAIDSDGFLYQSNFATGAIYKIAPNGSIVDANYASVSGPVGIAAAPDNTLYICSCNTNSIKKVSPDGVLSDFVAGSFFNCANGITIGDNDNLYTTNFSDGRITKISPDGTMETLGNTSVGNGHITYRPGEEMLYIASYSGHRIFKMDLDGNVEILAGTGVAGTTNSTDPLQARFRNPNGIAISKDNCSLYITQDDNVIRAIHLNDASCISNIENIENHPDLKIYPNPTSDILQFENKSTLEWTAARFLDSQGKTLMNTALSSDSHLNFDISSFPSGIYSVLLSSRSGRLFSYRFVKQP